jgi:phospholipid/cholesterol/gamma-HCH transport system permease protein
MLAGLGATVRYQIGEAGELLGLFSLTLRQSANLLYRSRRHVFWVLFKRQLYNTGFKAAYVNSVIATLLGMGMANQIVGYVQKVDSFADLFVVIIVRELAPLISGVILIARSSTAITAEIGHLQLNDEFEVMKSQGVSPIFFFMLPVFFAFPLSLALMLVYFNFVAMLASWVYVELFSYADWPLGQFIHAITDRLSVGELIITATKAVAGGVMIGLVSLYSGYQVEDRFTDISRMISNSTTSLLLGFFVLNIGLSLLAY